MVIDENGNAIVGDQITMVELYHNILYLLGIDQVLILGLEKYIIA